MKKISVILLLLLGTVSVFVALKPHKPKRPNIVFIMSDDHAYQAISAYDKRLTSTPNIDRIAKDGMLFTNACVTILFVRHHELSF
jgi:hypothetical protein